MDERAREICATAYDTLDHVKEQQAIWDAERQAALQSETLFQRIQREGEEADAFLAQLEQRRRAQQPEPEKPQPKARPQMDLNEWFAAGFRNFAALERKWVWQQFDLVVKIVAEETQRKENELRVQIKERVKTLEAEIAGLRAEIEILRQHKANKPTTEGSITSLRNRSVAA